MLWAITRRRLRQTTRVVNEGEIRQLVHHDRRRVEDVDNDGLDAPAPQRTGVHGGTRRPKDHRSGLQEQRHEPRANSAGGPGEQHSCTHQVLFSVGPFCPSLTPRVPWWLPVMTTTLGVKAYMDASSLAGFDMG
jgi:hypothetical protein